MKIRSKLILLSGAIWASLSSAPAADFNWGAGGIGGAGTWDNGVVANWFNGTANVPWSAGNTAVFGGNPGVVTVSGPISGVAGLAFTTGGYAILGSRLDLAGPAMITVGPGLWATNNSSVSGTGGVTISGGGVYIAGGGNTNSSLTIQSGTIMSAVGAASLQHTTNLTVNGILEVRNNGANVNIAPMLNGSGLITNSSGTMSNLRMAGGGLPAGDFAGSIGGPVQVIFQGTATQILSGANTHTGFLLLRNSGTLRLAHPGALTPNSYLDLQSGTYNTIELAAGDFVRSNGMGAAGVRFNGGSAYFAALGAPRSVTVTNPTELIWGEGYFNLTTLGFGSSNSTHGVTWTEPFSLGSPSAATDRVVVVLDGPAAVDAEIIGNISGGANARLDKRGDGALLLSGNNTYSGETRLEAGTLMLANDSAAGGGNIRFHLSGATLRSADATPRTLANNLVFALNPILGSPGSGELIVNGNVDTGSGGKVIAVSNSITTFNNDFSGASANPNVKTGPGKLVFNAFTSASKPFEILEGTVALGPSGGLLSSNLLVGAGAVLEVSAVSGGYSLGYNQTLRGDGLVNGALTAGYGATLNPGTNLGTLTVAGDLTLADTRVEFELSDQTTEGSGVNDLLLVNGNLSLSGLSEIALTPVAGNLANGTYKLIRYTGALAGGAGNLNLSGFGGGATRQTASLRTATAHEVDLVVSGAPADLVWQGASPNPTWWDVATTVNWLRGVTPDAFYNFDNVRFDDSAATHNVELITEVSPSRITVDTGDTYVFSGAGNLGGIASLTKAGLGTLLLGNSGLNDNTGATTIETGTIQVGANDGTGSLGAGPVMNHGALKFQNLYPMMVRSAISGEGALIHEGQSELLLNGNSSFTGRVLVNTNALLALRSSASPASTAASLGNSTNVTVLSDGALSLALNGTFDLPLFLTGDGFQFESSGALRTAGNISWNGVVTLGGDATIGSDSGTLTLGNRLLGGGYTLTKAGAGALVLATNNSYGATIISAGTLQIGVGATNGSLGQSTGVLRNDGTLVVNRSDTVTIANPITGTGGVTQSGSGTLVLSGANTFTGETRMSAGVLAFANDAASGQGSFRFHLPATVTSSDTSPRSISNSIDFATSATFGVSGSGDLLFTGPVNTGVGAKTFTVNNTVTTFNSPIAGGPTANANTKSGPGTLIFNGQNTYDKPTVISQGLLLINGALYTNTVTVSGGILGGVGVISGPVTVQAGGTLAPGGSPGTLTINNTLTLGGTLAVEINKTSHSSDRIEGLTAVLYGGVLRVDNLSGALAAGDAFKLFSAGTYDGSFSSFEPARPGPGLLWDVSTLTTDGTLRVAQGGPMVGTNITAVVQGNTLRLSWPAEYTGWILEGQTNAPGTGLSGHWSPVAGSGGTNQVYFDLDPAQGSVFYRLIDK